MKASFFALVLGLLGWPGAFLSAQLADTDNSGSRAYVLTNTDRIRIAVFEESDLTLIARIDSQGNVNLPLVGEVRIASFRVTDAERVIENAYREGRFLRNPRVTISVEEYASREVSIQGQIRSPGRYPLPIESTMTILELVTRAGGLTDTARGTAVVVTRILPDGTKRTFNIDVDSMIRGRSRASVEDNSLILESGDIIFVPERII